MRLQDRVVIVTGGAQNIGRAYVRRLAAEGARVVVADVDEAGARVAAAECGEGRGLAVVTDVADPASVGRLVEATVDTFGRVDVLVNNAALFAALALKPVEEITVEEWDRVMAVNVRGVFLCAQAVIPQMKQQEPLKAGSGLRGKIVNVASAIILSGRPLMLHYVTSKGAVFAMTRALSREIGPAGITVNSLAPGFVATEGTRRQSPEEEFALQRRIRGIPRDQTPEDLEGSLVFLAADDSDFITGQMLVVNGGAVFW